MPKMTRKIINFFLLLSMVVLITAATHYFIGEALFESRDSENFLLTYSFNYVFTLAMAIFLILMKERKSDQLGFAYLGGISVKFILFFILIYPQVKSDGQVSRPEFANFFIPFTVCLLTEILFLIRLLRN